MPVSERLQELVDADVVGIDNNVTQFENNRPGGQHAGPIIRGTRIWYPKDQKYPMVDITIIDSKSGHKNREKAILLFELAMEW